MRTISVACVVVAISCASLGAQGKPVPQVADAAEQRKRTAVRALIKRGIDVNIAQPDGGTALHWAAHWNDVSVAQHLVGAGAHVNAANDYGVTPVFLAATNGSAAMLDLLLKAGGDANATLPSGETVLMTAVRSGSVAAIRSLVAKGAHVNAAQLSKGQTALMWAVADGNLEVARALVDAGADVRARSNAGFTALMFAAREGHFDLARLLLAAGDDMEGTAHDGSTPLYIATVRGHAELALFLLEQGATPDGNVDKVGHTPLMWAVGTFDQTQVTYKGIEAPGEWKTYFGIPDREAKLRLIKSLLARGADVNMPSTKLLPQMIPETGGIARPPHLGATAFIIAAHSADAEIMRLLLAAGADATSRAKDGQTAVMAACEGLIEQTILLTEDRRIEAIQVALNAGVDIEAQDEDGHRAMHVAARAGYHDVITFLLSKGAELNPLSKPLSVKGVGATYLLEPQSPLGLAEGSVEGIFYERPHTAEFLRKLGAKSIGRYDPHASKTKSP